MSMLTVKLIPGVNVEKTPVLNEAGISVSNLIRFRDGLVEKIGGWVKFYAFTVGGIVRALHAWQALNDDRYLATGTTTKLNVIADSVLTDITPQQKTTNPSPNFSTTSGSATVTITDSNISNVTAYDSIYLGTPVSIGGLILSGLYPITSVAGATTYRITASSNATASRANVTITGATNANPCVISAAAHGFSNGDLVYIYDVGGMTQLNGDVYTIANVAAGTFELVGINSTAYGVYTSGGTATETIVPHFTTVSASPSVSVTLPSHGLSAGDVVVLPVSTTVGGVTIQGNYPVTSVTSTNVFVVTADAAATSTTSASMNSGNVNLVYYITLGPSSGYSGYSIGTYSSGGYSTGSSLTVQTGTPITSTDWTLDNWGEYVLACPDGGAIYYWQPNSGFLNAQLISGGPIFNAGMFVSMQAQIVIAYGSTEQHDIGVDSDPLLIKWSAQLDFTDWTVTTTNQAGSYRLPTGSQIIGGLTAPHQDLIWTDLDLWSMNYLGYPLVYGFDKIGSNCGLVAKHAAVRQGASVYWMGSSNFYSIGAGGVSPIPCYVWDKVFQNLDTDNQDNIRAWSNTPFNEVWWFYPSSDSVDGENDSYVKLNTLYGIWDYGPLSRTAAIDQSVLGTPIAAGPTGLIYQHEIGYNDDGAPINSFFESGYFSLSEGEDLVFTDWILPDMKWNVVDESAAAATVQITFYATNYAGDTPMTYGPYNVTQATQFVNTRFRGRFAKIRIGSGDLGSFWRCGAVKVRSAQDGRR